jgi:hypothetical protein
VQLPAFDLGANIRSHHLYVNRLIVMLITERGKEDSPIGFGNFSGVGHFVPPDH